MARAELLVDRLVATGFIRPGVLWRGLQCCRPSLARWRVSVLVGLSGLLVEPLAWLQSLLFTRRLRRLQLPDDPIVVIGHWRSGTTYLHQLLASDPAVATARNTLTMAPQVALLLKPWIAPVLKAWMTRTRPIDAVPWGPDDPQEDELGLARLTFDTNMAGMAFPRNYFANFRRHVLVTTRAYERQWLQFCRLTWLHDGAGKTPWLTKHPAHIARVSLVLQHFPLARFVLLRRTPIDSIRSLVQVKQRLGTLVGLQPVPDQGTQVEETVTAHRELLEAFETSRHLIPDQQLLELDYDDLIHQPLQAVARIYSRFGLTSWAAAKGPIKARIDQARSYSADRVGLSQPAERRLQSLVKPT